jgi:membrane protein
MANFLKKSFGILQQSFSDFSDQNVMQKAAALAYYTIFSIAPMLIMIIFLCDIFYGREAIEGNIYQELSKLIGPKGAIQIQDLIKNAYITRDSVIAKTIGIFSLVLGATGVFAEIQTSINTIWHLKANPKKGLIKFLLTRLISFSMILGLGFILLVSLVVSAVLDTLGDKITKLFPETSTIVPSILNFGLTFLIISVLFGAIFKLLPDARLRWRDVRTGAFTTAILFMIGRFIISIYLSRSNIDSTYGAAGSIVIVLLWVYYSAIILYFGAVFTKVYLRAKGVRIYPNQYAVWISQIEVEKPVASSVEAIPPPPIPSTEKNA